MRGALLLALALSSISGCRSRSSEPLRPSEDAASSAPSDCTPRATERLGIPFSKLCRRDLPLAAPAFEPYWISAQPLPCSAGEHETLRCPAVASIQHPVPGDERAPAEAPLSLAAVIEAKAAQSWCYMRFGGRLPTREERARAEVTLGLAVVIVSRSAGEPVHFELARQAEWVTEERCETPNAAGCTMGMYPIGARRPIPWDSLVACRAAPVAADAGPALAIGEICPAPAFDWDSSGGRLPCAVKSPVEWTEAPRFALFCRRPLAPGRHPDDDPAATAAVRCVMPGSVR